MSGLVENVSKRVQELPGGQAGDTRPVPHGVQLSHRSPELIAAIANACGSCPCPC
jgi:hypothetical protein